MRDSYDAMMGRAMPRHEQEAMLWAYGDRDWEDEQEEPEGSQELEELNEVEAWEELFD